jgi:hypothetical protein
MDRARQWSIRIPAGALGSSAPAGASLLRPLPAACPYPILPSGPISLQHPSEAYSIPSAALVVFALAPYSALPTVWLR